MPNVKQINNPVQSMKVFVSSTYADMKLYREKTMDALRQLQQTILVMEDFGANPEPPLSVCRSYVEQCDLFLLIVGFKYGSITENDKSYTESEYEYAVELKKKILVFIVDDSAEIQANLIDRGSSAQKLDNFKKKLTANHTVKFFNTVDSLYGYVHEAVQRELQQRANTRDGSILEGKEALNVFKKFVLMPNNYNGKEAILPLCVTSGFSGWMLKDNLVASLGLVVGDTVECDVTVIDDDTNEMLSESLQEIALFADGVNAQWLVDNVTKKNTIITAQVRFVCRKIRGISKDTEEEAIRVVLILVKGIDYIPPDE